MRAGLRSPGAADSRRQMSELDRPGPGQHRRAADRVAELAAVAGPRVAHEPVHGFIGHMERAPRSRRHLGEEVLDQHRDVLEVVAQRGHRDLERRRRGQ